VGRFGHPHNVSQCMKQAQLSLRTKLSAEQVQSAL
jgi:hypothetical protein